MYQTNLSCNNTLCNRSTDMGNDLSNDTTLYTNGRTYLEKSLGFLIVGAIGIISNLFAICVLGSSVKTRKKLVNTLIIHQSTVDFLASVLLVGMAHIDLSDQHGLGGINGDLHCFFAGCKWPFWLMSLVSSFSLIFLNIERYISIAFPIFHHTKVTRKKVLSFLPIVWVLGLLEQSFTCSCFTAENGTCALDVNAFQIAIIIFISFHFFIPLLVVSFLYGHMFILLKRKAKSKDSSSSNRTDVMEKARSNVFRTMLLITICYGLCYVFNCTYITLVTIGIFTSFTGKLNRID